MRRGGERNSDPAAAQVLWCHDIRPFANNEAFSKIDVLKDPKKFNLMTQTQCGGDGSGAGGADIDFISCEGIDDIGATFEFCPRNLMRRGTLKFPVSNAD